MTWLLPLCFLLLTAWAQPSSEQEKAEAFQQEWCGSDDCYKILGVTPSATRGEIKKVYRALSLKLHPDKNKNNATAAALHKKVVAAYEILSDSKKRSLYDYVRSRKNAFTTPRESPYAVLICVLGLTMGVVWAYQNQRYGNIRSSILKDPRVRRKLAERMDGGRPVTPSRKGSKKKDKKKDKEAEEEEFAKKVTDEDINGTLKELQRYVPGWSGQRPTWQTALMTMAKWPLDGGMAAATFFRWHVSYTLLGWDYSDADLERLCIESNQIDQTFWDSLTDETKQKYLKKAGPWRRLLKVHDE